MKRTRFLRVESGNGGSFGSSSNLQPQLPELLQRLSISLRIIYRIVSVGRDAIFFPLCSLRGVFDQSGVETADPAAWGDWLAAIDKATEMPQKGRHR